jgi:hypothetical protein
MSKDTQDEKRHIKKNEHEVNYFNMHDYFLKWYELHKDDIKYLKTNTINKIISIPD